MSEDAIAAFVKFGEAQLRDAIDVGLEQCNSPIERLLLPHLALMEMPFFNGGHSQNWWPTTPHVRTEDAEWANTRRGMLVDHPHVREDETASLFMQAPIGDYRADFLLLVKLAGNVRDVLRIVIECDGHDFHERTREQAKHDRRRDRAMTAEGFKVMRFTGSEIWRDAPACASEVRRFLWDEEYRTRDERGA